MRQFSRISFIRCPQDGPSIRFDSLSGEKYANCQACSRCMGCSLGGFVPMVDFREVG